MDYETGTATSCFDLGEKFNTFAVAHGWTLNTPSGAHWVLSKGDIVCGTDFVTGDATGFISLRGAVSYSGALAWDAQPGNSGVTIGCNPGTGAITKYHLFSGTEDGGELLACVIEKPAGVYRHIVLSQLVKYGSYTGGVYIDGTYWDADNINATNVPDAGTHRVIADAANGNLFRGQLYINYDSKTDNWAILHGAHDRSNANYATGCVRPNGINHRNLLLGNTRWNERAVMIPLELFVNRPSSLTSAAGRIPLMRAINMLNYVPGEILVVGTDRWIIFPFCSKTAVFNLQSTTPSSGFYGYAYRMP